MKAFPISFRRLIVIPIIAMTLMTSLLTNAGSAVQVSTDTFARNCVAHGTRMCREIPFPIYRHPTGSSNIMERFQDNDPRYGSVNARLSSTSGLLI